MISKQELHATDKIGAVDSKQESGLCYKFADSNIIAITKVLNFGRRFVAFIDIAKNCTNVVLEIPKTFMLWPKSWPWTVF